MVASPDLSVFGKLRSFDDYQRMQEEFDMRKQLQQAQIQESMTKKDTFDLDKMGEEVLLKAAMGAELSPQEQAVGRAYDAKRNTIQLSPITGLPVSKPPAFENLYGGNDLSVNNIDVNQIEQLIPDSGMGGVVPGAPGAGTRIDSQNLNPVQDKKFFEVNTEADRKRVDEITANKVSAQKLSSSDERMVGLLPKLGYMGTGAGAVGATDKLLTSMGAPNLIKGDTSAREALSRESVNQWVASVEPLKGALTEQEGARFDSATSSIPTTPEGVKLRAKISKAMAERAQEKSNFYQAWYQQSGTLFGADQAWDQYAEKLPSVIPDQTLPERTDKIGSAADVEFKLRKQGFTPQQVKEYMRVKGLR